MSRLRNIAHVFDWDAYKERILGEIDVKPASTTRSLVETSFVALQSLSARLKASMENDRDWRDGVEDEFAGTLASTTSDLNISAVVEVNETPDLEADLCRKCREQGKFVGRRSRRNILRGRHFDQTNFELVLKRTR